VEKLGDSGGIFSGSSIEGSPDLSSVVPLQADHCDSRLSFSRRRRSQSAAERTLLDAAEQGDHAAAMRLLAKGANANAIAPDGTTAIMWAAVE